MHLKFRNVNEAFTKLVQHFALGGIEGRYDPETKPVKKTSRNGDVLMIEEPVTITYRKPTERVLFNAGRDANPFFHLYESLWMLAGRNDVASVAYYASNMANYSDDGKTLNGAYGYRWREAKGPSLREQGVRSTDLHPLVDRTQPTQVDQLALLIDHLKADPSSRRAVLQMWTVGHDLLKIGGDCPDCDGGGGDGRARNAGPCAGCGGTGKDKGSKDVCCNLSVMFSLRFSSCEGNRHERINRCSACTYYLDMTVTNRSNDLVWGALGANVVHFSILQEYMAAKIGVEVGVYNQFTNNLHVYTERFQPEKWLEDMYPLGFHVSNPDDWAAQYREWKTIPLVKNAETFDRELPEIVQVNSASERGFCPTWQEPFFETVAQPMFTAYTAWKNHSYDRAFEWVERIVADDWRKASKEWFQRRIK